MVSFRFEHCLGEVFVNVLSCREIRIDLFFLLQRAVIAIVITLILFLGLGERDGCTSKNILPRFGRLCRIKNRWCCSNVAKDVVLRHVSEERGGVSLKLSKACFMGIFGWLSEDTWCAGSIEKTFVGWRQSTLHFLRFVGGLWFWRLLK